MALTTPAEGQNEKINMHKGDRKEKPLTKVVIRRLPPGITQEDFLTQVSPIPDYNYIYTTKGDMTLGENAFSRVYINFVNMDDIYNFKEKFDSYVFVDLKGHEYPAVVEFAAFQKIPKRRNKNRTDPKSGTVETDQVYLDFLESLKIQPTIDEKPEYSYQPSSENKTESSTPLLDYIKQRRMDRQRIKEEKREERKRKDLERKRIKDDERRRRYEEKSPTKTVLIKAPKEGNKEEEKMSDKKEAESSKADKIEEKSYSKYRDRKYEDRKSTNSYKSKYSRDYADKREYKNRRDDYRDYRNKQFEDKKEPEKFTKKVKKYSEKREERKSALKKFERNETASQSQETKKEINNENKDDDKIDETSSKDKDIIVDDETEEMSGDNRRSDPENEKEYKGRNKENDPRIQRRIRNKDRPTMAIYQPGMLRKKGSESGDESCTKTSEKDT